MGPGPFVEALEYASGKKALVVGKPKLEFFQSVLEEFNCLAEETVMIGDVRITRLLLQHFLDNRKCMLVLYFLVFIPSCTCDIEHTNMVLLFLTGCKLGCSGSPRC